MIGEEALKDWEATGKEDKIMRVKNSLSYYWAEIGENLDQALGYCLEILKISPDSDYIKEIKTRDFGKSDAPIIDTLGRVLESMGKIMDSLVPYIKANELDPSYPICLKNLKRAYKKLGERLKIT